MHIIILDFQVEKEKPNFGRVDSLWKKNRFKSLKGKEGNSWFTR